MRVESDPLALLCAGRFVDPHTRSRIPCPVGRVVLAENLDGAERDLVTPLRLGSGLAVVADAVTWEVLGARVARRLGAEAQIVLERPEPDLDAVEAIRRQARHAGTLVAVGGGTITDLCKLAAAKDHRRCIVFATAPSMTGYVTGWAILLCNRHRQVIAARPPAGAFFDLAVLAAAPSGLRRAGIGECLARSTAQADCLLGHLLYGQPYAATAWLPQADEEPVLLDRAAEAAAGEPEGVRCLVRLLLLNGLGAAIAGANHAGATGERLISHCLDLLAPRHGLCQVGEQVGLASWTMARLQAQLFEARTPPVVEPTRIDEEGLRRRHGSTSEEHIRALRRKALDTAGAERLNQRLAADWTMLRAKLRAVMLPLGRMERAMRAAGLPVRAADIGLAPGCYGAAVRHARELKDRYGTLDLAADSGRLDAFAAGEG